MDDYLSALTLELPLGMGSPHHGMRGGGGSGSGSGSASASASASARSRSGTGAGIRGGGGGINRGRITARLEERPTTDADLAMSDFLTSRVLAGGRK